MNLKHRTKGYTIPIQSQRGKPLITKDGLVLFRGKGWKGMDRINLKSVSHKFEIGS